MEQPLSRQLSWRDFIALTKPGIIRSNLITGFAGFWVASKWSIDWPLLLYTLLGLSLMMASGCVLNNFLDRERDMKMERTQNRALPTGRIQPMIVLLYGIVLGVAATIELYYLVNPLSAVLGLVGHFFYVVVYTAWLKPRSTWSTSVGGVSGAMPPVIGYTAVTNEIDAGAWVLFAILFLWQPPHFWALGIRRLEEYRAAGFPLLPVVKGVQRTKIQMIPYLLLLYPATILLYAYGYAGMLYLIFSLAILTVWTVTSISGFWAKDEQKWARNSFKYSLYFLTLSSLVMIINTVSS
ncbi:heme o synthase [Paenibacillus turpanensis]|uniref:heme o synthase n=1 Tax=Paenibacillus turpanensis TaxID=2689078 RepID=UPI003132F6C7